MGNDVLNSLVQGNRMLSPNSKFISSVLKQSEYSDEEMLEKVSNKYYTPTEFNNALNKLLSMSWYLFFGSPREKKHNMEFS